MVFMKQNAPTHPQSKNAANFITRESDGISDRPRKRLSLAGSMMVYGKSSQKD
jgi:hypothetical protein